jgi:hypothetical protein
MNDVQLTGWFYLSFADDDAFYGGVIVNAPEFMLAHLVSRVPDPGGLSSGGQVSQQAPDEGGDQLVLARRRTAGRP